MIFRLLNKINVFLIFYYCTLITSVVPLVLSRPHLYWPSVDPPCEAHIFWEELHTGQTAISTRCVSLLTDYHLSGALKTSVGCVSLRVCLLPVHFSKGVCEKEMLIFVKVVFTHYNCLVCFTTRSERIICESQNCTQCMCLCVPLQLFPFYTFVYVSQFCVLSSFLLYLL